MKKHLINGGFTMNLTQNDRLNQVTADTLVVGVDIGSETHFARCFDWRGYEFSKRAVRFSNTPCIPVIPH
jgi:hypothetical protein